MDKRLAEACLGLTGYQVEWLRERIQAVPLRLVFESALELMGCTQIGTFKVRRTVRGA